MKSTIFLLIPLLTSMVTGAQELNKWKKPEGEPIFVAIHRTDERMMRAYQRAKETLPRFLEDIRSDHFSGATCAVKIKIRDDTQSKDLGEDRFVYLWVYEVGIDGQNLRAKVRELPKEPINDLVVGKVLSFPREQVFDWMIIKNGNAWGAFTIRVVREPMSEKERAQFDEYTGITNYEEEAP